ncbi:MAG: zwf, partial [Candidatus Saccharibacteria bacterium]|nr:zwf [Candidatus Saccharibacteria bacterium]
KLLEAVTPISELEVMQKSVRGQYEGYREEVGNPGSTTETYAVVSVGIAAERWRGVPITLRTGKAMAEKRTDVRLTFTPEGNGGELIFRIQPDAHIAVRAGGQPPQFIDELQKLSKEFNAQHPPAITGHPDAYERVLLDAVRGDHTLFTTSEEVIAAWKVVTAVVKVWAETSEGLIFYPKGTISVE